MKDRGGGGKESRERKREKGKKEGEGKEEQKRKREQGKKGRRENKREK